MNRDLLAAFGLVSLVLTGCGRTPPSATKDDTDTDVADTEDTVDTEVDDTEVDDTEVDTDDTEVDTNDTDTDDTDDTDVTPFCFAPCTPTTIEAIQSGSGGFTPGSDLLGIQGAVVTAISNLGFAVQDPNATLNAGIYVFTAGNNPAGLTIGTIVDVIGDYEEFDNNGSLTGETDTLAELIVTGGIARIDIKGTGGTITPVEVTLADLNDTDIAEDHEAMVVTLRNPLPLVRTGGLSFGEFDVTTNRSPLTARIDQLFYSIPNDSVNFPGFADGVAFDSITGVVWFDFDTYKVSPRFSSDAEGYDTAPSDDTATPPDTNDTGDTDLDSGDTGLDTDMPTGDTGGGVLVPTGDTDPDTFEDTAVDTDPDTFEDTAIQVLLPTGITFN